MIASPKWPNAIWLVTSFSLLVRGIAIALLPWMGSYIGMFGVIFIGSVTVGYFIPAAKLLCLDIWKGGNCGPAQQTLGLSLTLGMTLLPFFIKPFLSTSDGIKYYYPLVGLITALTFFIYLPLGIMHLRQQNSVKRRNEYEPAKREEGEEKEGEMQLQRPQGPPKSKLEKRTIVLITCGTLFNFLQISGEQVMTFFLPTFGVYSVYQMEKDESVILSTILGAGILISRAISVFVAAKVRPSIMILTALVISVTSLLTTCFAYHLHIWILYGSIFLYGFGAGPIAASLFMWLHNRMKDTGGMTGTTTGILQISSMVATGTIATVAGQFIQTHPMVIFYASAAFNVIGLILFASLNLFTHQKSTSEIN